MARWGRRMAMAAAGLMTAAPPLFLGQQPAGAAETTDQDSAALTFVTDSGATVTCTGLVSATHDTDVANQPELRFGTGLSGPGSCFEIVFITATASYKDQDGITRTARFVTSDTSSVTIQGAYTNTTVSVNYDWVNCDETQSATCEVTVTASPK
jgi:hypothetical protein